MTTQELRALDAEIHRKVMGKPKACLHLAVTRPDADSSLVVCDHCKREFGTTTLAIARDAVPRYSSDIASAWLVVEEMLRRVGVMASVVHHPDGWGCRFGNTVYPSAETAPQAICLAALKATEGKS